MTLRVNDDSNLFFALRQTNINHSEMGKRLAKLASGMRINSASDDASGLAVLESLGTQSRGLNVASRNIQDFTSLAQTAEAGMSGIQDMSQRINELAVQASSGTLTDGDRQLIQNEVNQLTQEIDRQAGAVEFNRQPLLNGSFSSTAQVGPNAGDTFGMSISSLDTAGLGLSGIDVSTQAGAQNAIGAAQGAVNLIGTERAAVGGMVNRLESAFNFSGALRESTLSAEARIGDADMAAEIIGMTTAQVREKAGVFSLAQGNLNRQNVLRLLGE